MYAAVLMMSYRSDVELPKGASGVGYIPYIIITPYQLYLNSVNNSPLTSFDEWFKQNYYFTKLTFQVAQVCKQKEQFQVQ